MVPSGGNCSPFDWNHLRVLILTDGWLDIIFKLGLASGNRGNSFDADV